MKESRPRTDHAALPADQNNSTAASKRQGQSSPDSQFYVAPIMDFLGGLVHRNKNFLVSLGNLESAVFAHDLKKIAIKAPTFVCGLARSGSTLLHEIICSHPGVASHRMKDFPLVFTPYWWRRATANLKPEAPRERLHRDRVMVTTESPDAVEEMLWMAFFPTCHDPSVSNVLTANTHRRDFEAFYRNHICKLLLVERAARYAAKANYHVARLAYLARLFPDCRFVIPIRAPAGHIASLMRQHQWFSGGHRQYPRALAFMQRSGHFEFGLDRRPINLGDAEKVRAIQKAWASGEEVRGLAKYWAMVYSYLASLLATDAAVRRAAIVVPYESMCKEPEESLRKLLEHCDLPDTEPIIGRYAPAIKAPDYYRANYSEADLAVIRTETEAVAKQWGYE